MELPYSYTNLHGVTPRRTAFCEVTEVITSNTALNTCAFLVRTLLPSFFEFIVTKVVWNTGKTRLGNKALNWHVVELLRTQEYVTACKIFVISQNLNRFCCCKECKQLRILPFTPNDPPPLPPLRLSSSQCF